MENTKVSLYVILAQNGNYFAGFDSEKGVSKFVTNPQEAKKFTNKFDIKLRPEEMLVEIIVDLGNVPLIISDPFRPVCRRSKTNIRN